MGDAGGGIGSSTGVVEVCLGWLGGRRRHRVSVEVCHGAFNALVDLALCGEVVVAWEISEWARRQSCARRRMGSSGRIRIIVIAVRTGRQSEVGRSTVQMCRVG